MEELNKYYQSMANTNNNQETIKYPTLLKTTNDVSSYINKNIDAILFDCDGVLYRGSHLIPNASDTIKTLITTLNKKVFFVTNNAGQNRKELCNKLTNILELDEGFLNVNQMISSSYSCSRFLQEELSLLGDVTRRVHVVGSSGLIEEIKQSGFEVSTVHDEEPHDMNRDDLATYDFNKYKPIDALVIGLDTLFSYRKLCVAIGLLQRYPNALLVATNEDAYDLVGLDARWLPGNGSLVRAIEYSSRRKAINVGKPSNILSSLIQKEHNLDPSRTMFVGDRLDTDIKFANDGDMISALVLTGVTGTKKLRDVGVHGTADEPVPHVVFPHIGFMSQDNFNQ